MLSFFDILLMNGPVKTGEISLSEKFHHLKIHVGATATAMSFAASALDSAAGPSNCGTSDKDGCVVDLDGDQPMLDPDETETLPDIQGCNSITALSYAR